jgi:riboflavin kinase / FMN adenylyltransferase
MLVTRGIAPSAVPGHPRASLVSPAGCALTIGNFDGLHRGHQAMIARVLAVADERGLRSAALTFEPHPRERFTPQTAPTRLTSLREKLELLREHGVQQTHVAHFTHRFASIEPAAFVERVLVGTLNARWILVGDDFRFGARRSGDRVLLESLAARYGYELGVMPTVIDSDIRISSSAVRDALHRGDLARATGLLGRPYSISGRIVHGQKLGRQLGFATANVQLKHNRPPLMGIFAVLMHGIGERPVQGVASLGFRPTVTDERRASLEVHLFDFAGDLYGRHLRVEFLHKIRDEEKYPDLDTLRAAIQRDCDAARAFLTRIQ